MRKNMTEKTSPAADTPANEAPLESWKEIAAYLKRDTRTVRRWEKSEGLPVRRHLHETRSSVYAYPSELDAWGGTRQPRLEKATASFWRPAPVLASAAVLLLSLLSVASGPILNPAGAVAQESRGMVARLVWSPDASLGFSPDQDSVLVTSTDGRYLTYADGHTGQLVVRDLATGENRHFTNKGPLEGLPEAEDPVISPDGQQIVYPVWRGERYDLRLVPVSAASSGAPPRILHSSDEVPYVAPKDWSPDGKQILAAIQRKDKTIQLGLISAADGSVRVLKTLDWRWPDGRFSPDGRYIAYDIQLQRDSPNRGIFVLATDGSRETTLVENPGDDYVLGWAPDGKRILFASDRMGSKGAWSIGVAEGRPQGSPELVKGDIGDIHSIGSTRSGALYYRQWTNMRDIYIASLDMATGKVTVPPAPVNPRLLGGNKTSAAWSPDGQYLAYRMADGVTRIRSMKTDEERELPSNLLRIDTRFGRIRWSPDGRSLLASASDDKQRRGLYQIDVQTGAVASIVQDEGAPYGVWSADGKAVFYTLDRPAESTGLRTNPAIRVRDLETGREREIYRPALPLPTRISHLALSPDGQWLAFVSVRESEIASNPPTEEKLLVMPAAGGDPRELLKVHKGAGEEVNDLTALEWTRDGDQLVYHWNRELWKISAKGGEPQKLGLASTTARQTSLSLHPDGQRIAFTAGEPKFDVWVMENFWPALPASR